MHWLTVFIARQRVKHLLVEAQAELREHFHLSAVWTRWNVMHVGKGATTALTFFPQNPLYIYLFIYLCHISLQRHHTSYSTLQSVQEAEDKINHSRARQRVLAPLALKKTLFLQVLLAMAHHILYHNKLAFGSDGRTQCESACPPLFSCSFKFISTDGLSS